MRILLANQFYPPDVAPTGQVLHDLGRRLAARGHSVTALCSRRSYDGGGAYAKEEMREGVAVRRLSALGFGRRGSAQAGDFLSFHVATLLGAGRRSEQFDLAVCLTTPPYLGWTVARALGRRVSAMAHWVMDLYPDVLSAHGSLPSSGLTYRALQRLTMRQFSTASLVLALGPWMRERVAPYVTGGTKLEWVPLWGMAPIEAPSREAVAAWRERRGWGPGECVLLYSGNMGLGHRMGEFLSAAQQLGKTGPIWAFAGGGRRHAEVVAAVQSSPRVQMLPYVPRADLAASLAAADVHLVSLRRSWQGLIVPSKLQAAFSLGRPVIFVGPRENEAAEWVLASGGGWVAPEDDVAALRAAVEQAGDAVEREHRGAAALAFAREHFDRERNCDRIAHLLEQCVSAANSKSVD
jgi:glycosyltransferase involved in cell wall biosynthesis